MTFDKYVSIDDLVEVAEVPFDLDIVHEVANAATDNADSEGDNEIDDGIEIELVPLASTSEALHSILATTVQQLTVTLLNNNCKLLRHLLSNRKSP